MVWHYNNDSIGEVMWSSATTGSHMVPQGKIVGREIAVLGSDRVVVQVLLVMKTK